MKNVITNGCNFIKTPAISKGFKYIILFTFAIISINSAQNNPIKKETASLSKPYYTNLDSIGRVVEANWDSIDQSRAIIISELTLLKQKIKNNERPIILIADTVYITDTVIGPRNKILNFKNKTN